MYQLVYDALGRCVKRSLNGLIIYYVYDGEKPILEYDAGGAPVGVNLYGKGIDEILERVAIGSDNQWHIYFFQQNHEGSVTLLTDTAGNVIERYRYDVFGAPTIYDGNWNARSSTIYDNRFLFTGREYAATYRSTYNTQSFTFYEYRARAYNPQLGRFMSEDPKGFDAGDYNLFRYCHNDPIDFTDPMGLIAFADAPITNPEIQAQYTQHLSANEALWDRQMNMSASFGATSYGMAAAAKDQLQRDLAGIKATTKAAEGSSVVTNPRGVVVLRNENKTDQLAFSDPLRGVRSTRGG